MESTVKKQIAFCCLVAFFGLIFTASGILAFIFFPKMRSIPLTIAYVSGASVTLLFGISCVSGAIHQMVLSIRSRGKEQIYIKF